MKYELRPLVPDFQAASAKVQDQRSPDAWPRTHVCSLTATLQNGPVDAGDQPRAQDAADEKPGEAGAQAQQHIVEEQKVVEVVECSPANKSRWRGSTFQYEKVAMQVGSGAPQTCGQSLRLPSPSCVSLCC